MTIRKLEELLKVQFPKADFNVNTPHLGIGSFPEWDSLGNFNFLMLVEETYKIRFSSEQITELKSLDTIRHCLFEEYGVET